MSTDQRPHNLIVGCTSLLKSRGRRDLNCFIYTTHKTNLQWRKTKRIIFAPCSLRVGSKTVTHLDNLNRVQCVCVCCSEPVTDCAFLVWLCVGECVYAHYGESAYRPTSRGSEGEGLLGERWIWDCCSGLLSNRGSLLLLSGLCCCSCATAHHTHTKTHFVALPSCSLLFALCSFSCQKKKKKWFYWYPKKVISDNNVNKYWYHFH